MTDFVLTILTGQRADLLERTLDAMRAHAPGLLEAAHVVVLHNGGDEPTRRALEWYLPLIDRLHVHPREPLLTIGEASSMLAMMALESGRPYTLRCEDDWEAMPDAARSLALARAILLEPDIYEVRLRLASMPCWAKHAITGAPIVWSEHDGYRLADAHLSIAPTLCRTADLRSIFPADGEKDAMRRAHAAGFRRVAQLVPGVFTHIGDGRSLRKQTRCAA